MSRLPVPGNDDGVWGDVLNDYLLQSHDTEGQLKPGSINTAQLQNGAVTTAKLSSSVQSSLSKANSAVLTVNGTAPDEDGNVIVAGVEGPQGPRGEQGEQGIQGEQGVPGNDGQDGTSVTVILVPAAEWPAPSDLDPLHWYVKVP